MKWKLKNEGLKDNNIKLTVVSSELSRSEWTVSIDLATEVKVLFEN